MKEEVWEWKFFRALSADTNSDDDFQLYDELHKLELELLVLQLSAVIEYVCDEEEDVVYLLYC